MESDRMQYLTQSFCIITISLCLILTQTRQVIAEESSSPADNEQSDRDTNGGNTLGEGAWPYGLKFNDSTIASWNDKRTRKRIGANDADALLWVPPKATTIRAVVMIPRNTDTFLIAEHPLFRKLAAERGIAALYFKHLAGAVIERSDPPTLAAATFDEILSKAAEATWAAIATACAMDHAWQILERSLPIPHRLGIP